MGFFQDLFGSKKNIIEEKSIETETPKRVISDISDIKKAESEAEEEEKRIKINRDYKLPSIEILNKPKINENSREVIEKTICKLEFCLNSFKINSKVVEVHIGPVMTRYELEVASGTDLSKISRLNREIALALSKKDVTIEIPIPGKNTVGITIDNDIASTVSFYEMMSSKEMEKLKEKELMVPLGKTPIGDICVCEINKMPHLLISGTTGSGKTALLNNIICSILMRAKPDEVKLVLIDTKIVEFNCYNGIPHLMCPVVSDPKKVIILLQKILYETEKRYQMFVNTGTKKIEEYNEYVEKRNKTHSVEQIEKIPYIVVVIDDLLDLMVSTHKEIEDLIIRITQKARTAGVHLIISTQRPSKEVLTDIIKTSIPSRISFVVSSKYDSNIVLDQEGAENLSGHGDMLYLPIGMKKPVHIQGTYIHDNEIHKIINFVKTQQEAFYDNSFMKLEKKIINANTGKRKSDDELYNEIVDFVVKTQKASASLLQRKFKIGYNMAATMIDKLEENGIIGPAIGIKPRDVLVKYSSEEK